MIRDVNPVTSFTLHLGEVHVRKLKWRTALIDYCDVGVESARLSAALLLVFGMRSER